MPMARRRATDHLDQVLTFMGTIWAVDHALERASKQMEVRLGVTAPQRMCLLLIAARPGILASELAAALHLHRGTMSGILRRLEQAGFITRTLDPDDRRRSGLHITTAGTSRIRSRDGTVELAVRKVMAATSVAEREAAERVLLRLQRELNAL